MVQAIIGTRPEERLHPQDVILNISFIYDASLASQTDALGHAVDYGALHDRIVREVAVTQFLLLERLADFILGLIIEDTRIVEATIVIDKPRVFTDVRSIAVEMSVSRSDVLSKKSSLRCY
ncbi:MAG: dihydroneopterin aldolase [Candidatus Omnitrophica bacterium]|nr:dihydroneopterin aldolase [Candidatus Omnitrophota bacterium]